MASDEWNVTGGGDDQTIHYKRVIYTATEHVMGYTYKLFFQMKITQEF